MATAFRSGLLGAYVSPSYVSPEEEEAERLRLQEEERLQREADQAALDALYAEEQAAQQAAVAPEPAPVEPLQLEPLPTITAQEPEEEDEPIRITDREDTLTSFEDVQQAMQTLAMQSDSTTAELVEQASRLGWDIEPESAARIIKQASAPKPKAEAQKVEGPKQQPTIESAVTVENIVRNVDGIFVDRLKPNVPVVQGLNVENVRANEQKNKVAALKAAADAKKVPASEVIVATAQEKAGALLLEQWANSREGQKATAEQIAAKWEQINRENFDGTLGNGHLANIDKNLAFRQQMRDKSGNPDLKVDIQVVAGVPIDQATGPIADKIRAAARNANGTYDTTKIESAISERGTGQSLVAGWLSVEQLTGAGIGAVGEFTGIKSMAEWGNETARVNGALRDAMPKGVTLKDVKSVGSAITYSLQLMGEQFPQLAIGGGASALGRVVAGSMGAKAGAFGSSYLMGTGEVAVQNKEIDPDAKAGLATMIGGGAVALLDSVSDIKIGKMLLGANIPPEAAEALAQRILLMPVRERLAYAGGQVAKETLKGVGAEAPTEGLQTVIAEIATAVQTGTEIKPGLLLRAAEASLAGALVGGQMTGGIAAAQQGSNLMQARRTEREGFGDIQTDPATTTRSALDSFDPNARDPNLMPGRAAGVLDLVDEAAVNVDLTPARAAALPAEQRQVPREQRPPPQIVAPTEQLVDSAGKPQRFVIPEGIITSRQGNRKSVRTDNGAMSSSFHAGVDIAPKDPRKPPAIGAGAEGVAIVRENAGGYGKQVIIKHADGSTTSYSHLQKIMVKNGEVVPQHKSIGIMGSTGNSTGVHVHIETRDSKGRLTNPLAFREVATTVRGPKQKKQAGETIAADTELAASSQPTDHIQDQLDPATLLLIADTWEEATGTRFSDDAVAEAPAAQPKTATETVVEELVTATKPREETTSRAAERRAALLAEAPAQGLPQEQAAPTEGMVRIDIPNGTPIEGRLAERYEIDGEVGFRIETPDGRSIDVLQSDLDRMGTTITPAEAPETAIQPVFEAGVRQTPDPTDSLSEAVTVDPAQVTSPPVPASGAIQQTDPNARVNLETPAAAPTPDILKDAGFTESEINDRASATSSMAREAAQGYTYAARGGWGPATDEVVATVAARVEKEVSDLTKRRERIEAEPEGKMVVPWGDSRPMSKDDAISRIDFSIRQEREQLAQVQRQNARYKGVDPAAAGAAVEAAASGFVANGGAVATTPDVATEFPDAADPVVQLLQTLPREPETSEPSAQSGRMRGQEEGLGLSKPVKMAAQSPEFRAAYAVGRREGRAALAAYQTEQAAAAAGISPAAVEALRDAATADVPTSVDNVAAERAEMSRREDAALANMPTPRKPGELAPEEKARRKEVAQELANPNRSFGAEWSMSPQGRTGRQRGVEAALGLRKPDDPAKLAKSSPAYRDAYRRGFDAVGPEELSGISEPAADDPVNPRRGEIEDKLDSFDTDGKPSAVKRKIMAYARALHKKGDITDDALFDVEAGVSETDVEAEDLIEAIREGINDEVEAAPAKGVKQRRTPAAPKKPKTLAEQIPGWSKVAKWLTKSEQVGMRKAAAEKLMAIFDGLPSAEEMASVAIAAEAKRGWYENSVDAIAEVFGQTDGVRFAALLAATSPQTSVESNLYNALKVWTAWVEAGRPTERQAIIKIMGSSVQGGKGVGSVLTAWINNTVTSLTTPDVKDLALSGPKVNSFFENLAGEVYEVTNDAWMANFANVDQKIFAARRTKETGDRGIKGVGYMAMSAKVRKAAEVASKITGDKWTPSEIQETVWSWAKTLYEMRDKAGETRSMVQLLEAGAVTDADIAATPDFATLFTEGVFGSILERGGYGGQVNILRSRGGGARSARSGRSIFSQGDAPVGRNFQRDQRRAAARLERVRERREQESRAKSIRAQKVGILRGANLSGRPVPVAGNSGANTLFDSPLKGSPSAIKVKGWGQIAFGPIAAAQQVARDYMASTKRQYVPAQEFVPLDKERAKRIADAFEAMEHNPSDPEVAASYRAMIDETIAQFKAIKATGLDIRWIDVENIGDPYADTPRLVQLDVAQNNRMWVFPTDDGFGSGTLDVSDNPLLEMTDIEIDGRKLRANDVFRIVHDYFGHVKDGHGFRAAGEENAWQSHASMYSPLARRAMTTETRGQNSWVNYGPHGEKNRNASSAETEYAPQKIGLLPLWVSEAGMVGDPAIDLSDDATWTTERVNGLVKDYGYSMDDAKSKAFAVMMTPDEFLGLTASEEGRRIIEERVATGNNGLGDADFYKKIDIDRLGRTGPISLMLNGLPPTPSDYQRNSLGVTELPAKVMGHDGRHRMTMLRDAGVERVPVVLLLMNDKATADLPTLKLSPQPGSRSSGTLERGTTPATVTNAIPISYDNRQRLREMGGAKVKFSRIAETRRESIKTPAFAKWFGKSKVVDADGNPMVVFHGTEMRKPTDDHNFDQFRTISEMGAHFGTTEQANGILTTMGRMSGADAARVYPVYLSIQNPLRLKDMGTFDVVEVGSQLAEKGIIDWDTFDNIVENMRPTEGTRALQEAMKKAGYDGIVYLNRREGLKGQDKPGGINFDEDIKGLNGTDETFLKNNPEARDSWIIFDKGQVKSATGNKGTYDATNPSILESRTNPRTASQATREQQMAKIDEAFDQMLAALKAMGLENRVNATVVASLGRGVAGEFDSRSLAMKLAAFTTADIGQTTRHEVVHWAKQTGVFSKAEWAVLEKWVKQDTALMSWARKNYPDLSREDQMEEAIAEGIARYLTPNRGPLTNPTPQGAVAKAIEKFRELIDAIRAAFAAIGFSEQDMADAVALMDDLGSGKQIAKSDQRKADAELEAAMQRPLPGTTKQSRTGGPSITPPAPTPETQARLDAARKGVAGDPASLLSSFKEGAASLFQGFARHYANLSNRDPRYAQLMQKLRQIEAAPTAAVEETVRRLRAMTKDMSKQEYELFSQAALLDDLTWDAALGKDLPFDYTPQTLAQHKRDTDAAVAANPKVRDALRRRQVSNKQITDGLVKAGIIDASKVNPGYYRHQVLEYAQARQAAAKVATGAKRIRTPKWAKREGSVKDINLNMIEAEFEWITRALVQIKTAEFIGWLKDSSGLNIRDKVVAQAKAQNKGALARNIAAKGPTHPDVVALDRNQKKIDTETKGLVKALNANSFGTLSPELQKIADRLTNGGKVTTSAMPLIDHIHDNFPSAPGAMSAAILHKALDQKVVLEKNIIGKDWNNLRDIKALQEKFAPDHTAWQPDEGHIFYSAKTLPEHVLDRMIADLRNLPGVNQTRLAQELEGAKTALVRGGQKYHMILPAEVAEQLSNMSDKESESIVGALVFGATRALKKWMLFNPRRILKYNINNLSGDLDVMFAGLGVKAFSRAGDATKELWDVLARKKEPSQNYKDAVAMGVFDSGMTISELPGINKMKEFEKLTQGNPDWWRVPGRAIKTIMEFGVEASQFRESIFRYSTYLQVLERLDAGESMQKIGYGASVPKIMDQLTDNKEKAAMFARDLIGDYGAISRVGDVMRNSLIPFYSFMEINIRRYSRLIGNAFDRSLGRGLVTTGALAASKGVSMSVWLGVRMGAMYGLMWMWNNVVMGGDEEEELDERQRLQPHLMLPRGADGQIRSIRLQGSFSDILNWFGYQDVAMAMDHMEKGRKSPADVLIALGKAPLNKVVTSLSPFIQQPIEAASAKKIFPDVTQMRPIKDRWRNLFSVFSLENEYDLVAGKASRGYLKSWTEATIYKRDAGEMAYNEVRGWGYDWMREKTGNEPGSSKGPNTEDFYEYRRALTFGDQQTADEVWNRMAERGVTEEQIEKMLNRARDPISGVKKDLKQEFLDQLTDKEQGRYEQAVGWAEKTFGE